MDKIAETFGIVDEKGIDKDFKMDIAEIMPEQASRTSYKVVPRETDNRLSVLKDFEAARENLLDIIKNGQDSIADLTALCSQAQNDKYYMALSSLMKTVTDANEKLLNLQEKIREIEKLSKNEPKHVTNQLIVTTAELQKLIQQKRED
jgi:hypothetical protein